MSSAVVTAGTPDGNGAQRPSPNSARRARRARLLEWLPGSATHSLAQLRCNWLRTLLTLLGIVFGVGSVIAMGSIGEGAQREILATIEAMGADVTHVKALPIEEAKLGDIVKDSVGLHRSDVSALMSLLPMAKGVAYRAIHSVRVTDLPLPRHRIQLFAVSRGFVDFHRLPLQRGRSLLPLDHQQQRRVAIIGSDLARKSFGDEDPLGKQVRLDYAYFEVVGVLRSRAASGDEQAPVDPNQYNHAVLVPIETAFEELSPPKTYGELDLVSFRVGDTAQTLAAKRVIAPAIRHLHGNVEDVEIVAPEELLRQRKKAQSVLNIVLISIAAISLLVGGIGVMNIMLANIMERVSEIGVRRAVGAKRGDIRHQFLVEAVIICVGGGLLGVLLGLSISFTVAWAVGLPIAFAWASVAASFVISVVVGVVFGLMPAIRAANIDPIEALQHG